MTAPVTVASTTQKFDDPDVTAKGERRARVPMTALKTLWFNTGTLCNIECENCYIFSSPTNDALVYLTRAEVETYLQELADLRAASPQRWALEEIGFTGGEPFMNPEMIGIAEAALVSGVDVLILTNAMQPMMRPRVKAGLLGLQQRFGNQLTMRISIDHYTAELHDEERGAGSFAKTVEGARWLSEHGFRLDAAGRTRWGEEEAVARDGFADLFAREGIAIDAHDPTRCVLFPEMDEGADTPEISTGCWEILGKSPRDIMCATSRMVVKRRGEPKPRVIACTLLPYADGFDMGGSLDEAKKPVKLNHPHCSKFCVLGGGSCSA